MLPLVLGQHAAVPGHSRGSVMAAVMSRDSSPSAPDVPLLQGPMHHWLANYTSRLQEAAAQHLPAAQAWGENWARELAEAHNLTQARQALPCLPLCPAPAAALERACSLQA